MTLMASQIVEYMDFKKKKKKNVDILRTKHYFSFDWKICCLHIKDYFMAKNCFVAELIFKENCQYIKFSKYLFMF